MAHTSQEGWTFERLPAMPAALLFSLKTFLAAMLALYIAFATGLDRPAWAMTSVYIVSQPISGAVLAKSIYRVAGTLVGGVFTLFAITGLVTAPPLLTFVLSLWMGGCLFLSLRDRTPRTYAFVLAGYSAAIIGFPAVDAPFHLFDTVTARVQEICLGILCATFVSAIFLPQTSHAAARWRVSAWLRAADALLADLLAGAPTRMDIARRERRLATEMSALYTLMIYLGYEPAVTTPMRRNLRRIYERTLILLHLGAEIRDRLVMLRAEGPLDPGLDEPLSRLSDWLREGLRSDPLAGAGYVRDVERFAAAQPEKGGWREATLLSLAARLKELIEAREDCRTLWLALETDTVPDSADLRAHPAGPPPALPAIDFDSAVRSTAALVLSLWVLGAYWILAAWPDGGTAITMVAALSSLTAAQQAPIRAMMAFIQSTALAICCVFVYQFALLPMVGDFFQLSLALAPVLLLSGVLMALPATGALGMGLAVNFCALLGLGNTFSSDFSTFANSNLAVLIGMVLTVAFVSVLRRSSTGDAAARLLRTGWRDITALASARGEVRRAGITQRVLDRLGLMAPSQAPRHDDEVEAAFAAAFSARGLEMLMALAPRLTDDARAQLERVLPLISRHYDDKLRRRTPNDDQLLAELEGLRETMAAQPAESRAAGLAALVSLQRGLVLGQEHRAMEERILENGAAA